MYLYKIGLNCFFIYLYRYNNGRGINNGRGGMRNSCSMKNGDEYKNNNK